MKDNDFFDLVADSTVYQIKLPSAGIDYIQKKLATEHIPYEYEMLKNMQSRLTPNDLVLDIGANIGNHTLFLGCVANCKVIAFEPNIELFNALSESIIKNSLEEQIQIYNIGLGKIVNTGHFLSLIPENLGAQSIELGSGDIIVRPLDSFVFSKKISMMKIDVEGMELDVLEGGIKLINNDRPSIYIECQNEVSFRLIHDWMSKQNYSYWDTFNATPTHLFLPNEQLNEDERLARLQYKIVQNDYFSNNQLSILRQNLDTANTKYRTATLQIAELKSKLVDFQKTEDKLKNTKFTLDEVNTKYRNATDNLSKTKENLEEANLKYRNTTEQIAVLKERLTSEEKIRHSAEENLIYLRTQFEQTESKLSEEQERLNAEIKELRAKGESQTALLQTSEKELIRTETELTAIKEALNEANQKYQVSAEQIDILKDQLTAEETTRRSAEERLVQIRVQLEQTESKLSEEQERLNAEIKELRAKGESQTALLQTSEKELIRIKTEFRFTNDRLSIELASNKNISKKMEKTSQLLTQTQEKFQKEKLGLINQIEKFKYDQMRNDEKLRLLDNELNITVSELASLNERFVHQVTQYDISLDEIENLKENLSVLNNQYHLGMIEISKLKDEMKNEVLQHENTTASLVQTKEYLLAANEKYRFQVGEVVPKLKNDLKLNVLKTKRIEDEYKRKLEQVIQQKIIAEEQVAKVRSTLSFQIGYQIVHGFKTWKSAFLLPYTLWQIRKNFNARQEKKISLDSTHKIQTIVSSKTPRNLFVQSENNLDDLSSSNERALKNLKDMRVACIMDEFTYGSYAPEANLFQLTPEEWQNELENCKPELLFIESAWRGKDDLWGNKVGHASKEVHAIVKWCNQHEIPTVFWNKEDPIHFETFLNTARLFDHVFTTDIDCIHRYKGALGHDRVYLLPFAAQPAVNNPIEKYERKDAFCFAGAYYVRYPDRTRDLGNFVTQLAELKSVEIYDRNFGKDDPNYQFPSEYQPFIVGHLPYDQIDKAYKGYNYAINLNSIKQSQTMFARRVYELLASNTLTISNFSRGVRLLFGDLVITTDNGEEIRRRLESILQDEIIVRKYRLAALRKVMSEHTYADRLSYIVSKLEGSAPIDSTPVFSMVALIDSLDDYQNALTIFTQQHYQKKKFYFIATDNFQKPDKLALNTNIVSMTEILDMDIDSLIDGDFIVGIINSDYYGPNYLSDIALATRYSDAKVIGKAAYYSFENAQIEENNLNNRYREKLGIPARSSAIHYSVISKMKLTEWIVSLPDHIYEYDFSLSIDEFNYCKNGINGNINEIRNLVDDLENLNVGISLHDLIARAEKIKPLETLADNAPFWSGEALSALFIMPKNNMIRSSLEGSTWEINSSLVDGKHEYLYAKREFLLSEINVQNSLGTFYFDTTPGLNLQIALIFLDAQKQRISHIVKSSNCNQEFSIPLGTAMIRFGLRVYASGSAIVRGIVWGHRPLRPSEVIGRSDYLILTNNYPSYDDLYKNAFVHSRVKAYFEHRMSVDVFRLSSSEIPSYHEFNNIDVITGSKEALRRLIEGGNYKSVLVHFFDENMWGILKEFINYLHVIVWVHGSEIQPYHRRSFIYNTDEERQDAQKKSELRMDFWKKVLTPIPKNLNFVFVSNYSAQTAMEDIGIKIPETHYRIIHNPINTDVFTYIPKSVEQRKRILSIRPYASSIYANDLSVQAVLMLKDKPFFNDLEFHFIGDGILFDELLSPLQDMDNVIIERRFLTQTEIADIHKRYGIFLCPSRMDSQGVSRDEAMSSGLVPITNAVTAIPEFVNEECGILASSENAQELAEGIAYIFNHPDFFYKLSENASKRVRQQSDMKKSISQEIELITMNIS